MRRLASGSLHIACDAGILRAGLSARRGQNQRRRKQAGGPQSEIGKSHGSCGVTNASDQEWAEVTGQIADRINPRDSGRSGGARQDRGWQGPERLLGAHEGHRGQRDQSQSRPTGNARKAADGQCHAGDSDAK